MTGLSRFKSASPSMPTPSSPSSPSLYLYHQKTISDEEDEGYFGDFNTDDEDDEDSDNPATTPFISHAVNVCGNANHQPQFSVLAVVASALRRSLVTCAVEEEDVASDVDIGWPTDVRHVSHVTFDRLNGFLGLPVELQPDLPRKPPSASASVFGVSAQSMQCSYDHRGNSVPVILLQMQNRLYSEGGLQAEGIFRINAENTQEKNVRKQLNKGVVPSGIDAHCLSGLIKAWFRELPSGILDSLTPEQVMRCNTEQDCTHLVKLLPPTDASLLDWAINLMADVVEHEHQNKMNARNIAMVFAPNMTQMADPLNALIHAVQVMNFLKTLILKTLHERDHHSAMAPTSLLLLMENTASIENQTSTQFPPSNAVDQAILHQASSDDCSSKQDAAAASDDDRYLNCTLGSPECADRRSTCKSNVEEKYDCTTPVLCKRQTLGNSFKEEYNMETEGILNRFSLSKGMLKLRRHPVFQLNKTAKKSDGLEL